MKKLFEKQKKLDDLILANLCKRVQMDITHKQLLDKDLLAVFVELGEFTKEHDTQEKKMLEFADLLHFLLSCGLALNIDETISKHDITLLYAQAKENIYQDAILNFNVKFSEFCNAYRGAKYWSTDREPRNIEKHYFKCFLALFDLAKTMGYSVQDIKNAYWEKNRENYKRQEGNY